MIPETEKLHKEHSDLCDKYDKLVTKKQYYDQKSDEIRAKLNDIIQKMKSIEYKISGKKFETDY